MKVSARNVLPGKVKAVTPGAVDSEGIVELAPGIEAPRYAPSSKLRM
jgi:molybdopterin-binding protein